LVSMYGCTGGTVRADEVAAPAIEAPNVVVETPGLAGKWQSMIGLDDQFPQDGPDFALIVNGSGQLGMGTVTVNVSRTESGVCSAWQLDAGLAKKASVSPTM